MALVATSKALSILSVGFFLCVRSCWAGTDYAGWVSSGSVLCSAQFHWADTTSVSRCVWRSAIVGGWLSGVRSSGAEPCGIVRDGEVDRLVQRLGSPVVNLHAGGGL